MSDHINMASDIGTLASDLDFYKNSLPLPLKLAAANLVREMHRRGSTSYRAGITHNNFKRRNHVKE